MADGAGIHHHRAPGTRRWRTVVVMGDFLDHLVEASRELRVRDQRERRERAEIRADYERRSAAKGPVTIKRSVPAERPKLETL
jgi:hypothetical protein